MKTPARWRRLYQATLCEGIIQKKFQAPLSIHLYETVQLPEKTIHLLRTDYQSEEFKKVMCQEGPI